MSDRTISILGCGWLGLPLAQHLVQLGFSVRGSTTTEEKVTLLRELQIVPFCMEATPQLNGNDIKSFFQSKVCVLNIPYRRNLKDSNYYKQQIDSVIMALEASPVEFVIFASSTSIYPASLKLAMENVEIIPDTPRAETLLDIEQALLTNQNFQTTVLRFSGLYGGPRRIGQRLAGLKNISDGDSPVNLVHLDDCVAIVTQIIEKNICGEIINVTSDSHPTRREIYTKAAYHHGLTPPQFDNHPATRLKIVSNAKLKSTLNYTFLHPDPLNFE